MNWRLESCPKCGGDLVWDDGDEWRCWQCGRRYYANLPLIERGTRAEVIRPLRGIRKTKRERHENDDQSKTRLSSIHQFVGFQDRSTSGSAR